jgi:RNA-directed DNA polymerase
LENRNHEETQMTVTQVTGAPSTKSKDAWSSYAWPIIHKHVFRLQVRIAKADREGRRGKVKALQRLLASSFHAKCLAVKRVTSSTGSKTPGIDGVIWSTDRQKTKAISSLKRKGYKPQPLRRVYISKKSGKLRPLSIATIKDRAMQALYLLTLEPIAEERADVNAYGFRQKRSAHDAIEQCFKTLAKAKSATFVLEGDIKSCFDQISHEWLLENILMDKVILKKFLRAGYMENDKFYSTEKGVSQGSIISPALTVITLSGLETQILPTNKRQKEREKINVIAYADDFIVTAATAELLEQKVLPQLKIFLRTRGLELSLEKTKITPIEEGFNFLGFNIRKYKNGKLFIKPSKASTKDFCQETKTLIKRSGALPTEKLIYALNEKIVGWTNYYRGVVSSKTFASIDNLIFQALNRWSFKRHPTKGKGWIVSKYYTRYQGNNWRFHCMTNDRGGKTKPLYLKKASETTIRRHIKIMAKANPFNPVYKEYFINREKESKRRRLLSNIPKFAGLKIIQPYKSSSCVLGN